MPTHPIGAGTANLSVNVPRDIHRAIGRLAFQADVSAGEFVRGMFALAADRLADARLAGDKLERIAATLAKGALLVLFGIGLGAVTAAACAGSNEPRAFRNRSARRRDEITYVSET